VATYFLYLKTFGRAGGSSAVSAAAYRAGERIRDERSGKTYDHSDRRDVLHKEIVLPSRLGDEVPPWALDRSTLWNAAEHAESRANARVAREYLVALPFELSPPQRTKLAVAFSTELSDRYGFALDLTIHAARDLPGSDPRNFHAHLLATTREARLEGLGAKTTLEWCDGDRRKIGLAPVISELLHVRARWATVTNEALEEARVSARVDHRSLKAQGIDREPKLWIPRKAFEMERHGYRSALADRLRDEHRNRVQARTAEQHLLTERTATGAAEQHVLKDGTATRPAEQQLPREGTSARPAQQHRYSEPTPARPGQALQSERVPARGTPRQSLEEIRREARENWLRLRQSREQERAAADAAPAAGRDSDLER